MKIAICDDIDSQLKEIENLTKEYLVKNALPADIVVFNHSHKLMHALEQESFQIYLLDIVMPMINGIELGKAIRQFDREAQIIYITTMPEYALESFVANPINYLVKPIDKNQFFETLRFAISKIDRVEKIITVKIKEGIRVLKFSSIVSCERKGNMVLYSMLGGEIVKSLSIRSSFSNYIEPLLSDRKFLQTHTSFVMNMKYVKKITPKEFIMKDGSIVPISDKFYPSVSKSYLDFIFEKEDNDVSN